MAVVAWYPPFIGVVRSIPCGRMCFGSPCNLMMEFSYCLDCIFSSSPLWLHGNAIYEVRHNSLIVSYVVELYAVFTAALCKVNISFIYGERVLVNKTSQLLVTCLNYLWDGFSGKCFSSWCCSYVNSSLAVGFSPPFLLGLWLKTLSMKSKNADPLNRDNSCLHHQHAKGECLPDRSPGTWKLTEKNRFLEFWGTK